MIPITPGSVLGGSCKSHWRCPKCGKVQYKGADYGKRAASVPAGYGHRRVPAHPPVLCLAGCRLWPGLTQGRQLVPAPRAFLAPCWQSKTKELV